MTKTTFRKNLFGERVTVVAKPTRTTTKSNDSMPRGCAHCPLNRVPDVRKVKGLSRIRGRKAMLWAQNPGREENARGLELVGPAGQLLWDAAAQVGLTREDFDIQNVVRCWTVDASGEVHNPTTEELHCCSIYNEEALRRNAGKAVVHVILGKVAGKQLLGSAYNKSTPILWYAPWKAYVVLLEHPSYLLRLGGAHGAGWKYYHFRDLLGAVKSILACPGRYGYVYGQRYSIITTRSALDRLERRLRKEAEQGRRIAVDIEDAVVDGHPAVLVCGFSWGRASHGQDWSRYVGKAATVVLEHPQARISKSLKEEFRQRVGELLADKNIKKVFQHGSYDVPVCEEYFGRPVRGYDFDSQYGAYLRFPHLRAYSLASLCSNFFPDFADYKTMVQPYFKDDKCDMAQVPLKVLAYYNCADADLTKRVELKLASQVNTTLVKVYIQSAFTLEEMEQRGPWLDRQGIEEVQTWLPLELKRIRRQLLHISGDPNFNPNSSRQVAKLLYDQLGLSDVGYGRSTAKEALHTLATQTGHKAPELLARYRFLYKIDSTYLRGWLRSAEAHGGQLRTRWYLTGTATGRLRSGGGDDKKESHLVNFQNFHGNYLLLNLLVSDPRWRRALDGKHVSELEDLQVFLAADYSQIEIRMLAELSGDSLLISQLNSSEDIHSLVGAEITGWPVERIAKDKETRRLVKNIHFGIIFGLGRNESLYNYLVARGVRTSKKKCFQFYDRYFERYRGVTEFIRKQRRQAERKGYVETLFGFRREIGEWEDRSTYWGNQAINSPVQGTAHQLMLMALAVLHQKPRTYDLLRYPVVELHDALYFFIPLRDLRRAQHQLKQLLEHEVARYAAKHFHRKLHVPLLAETEAGFTLGSMTECEDLPVREFLKRWRKVYEERRKLGWEGLGKKD